ncbi:MAG: hypothetical protein ACFBSE_10840 [Prochloraceae cyanobacterium]
MFLLGISEASEIIKQNLKISSEAQASWDEAWRVTFMKEPGEVGNGFYFISHHIAMFIAIVAVTLWIIHWASRLRSGHFWQESIQSMIVVFLVALYLIDGASKLNTLVYGGHKVSRYWENSLMSVQIKGVEINSILNDKMVLETLKDSIRNSLKQCDEISPAFLPENVPTVLDMYLERIKCYEDVSASAQYLVEKVQNSNCRNNSCSGTTNWWNSFKGNLQSGIDAAQTAYSKEAEQLKENPGKHTLPGSNPLITPIADLMIGDAQDTGVKALLFGLQRPWVDIMEGGQFFGAMIAPVALALTLIPGKSIFLQWLAAFLNLMLLKVWYVVIIGIYAFVVSLRPTGVDHGWAWILGAFAPSLATAFTVGGAWAAMRSVGSHQAAIAMTVVNSTTAAISSFIPIMNFLTGKVR